MRRYLYLILSVLFMLVFNAATAQEPPLPGIRTVTENPYHDLLRNLMSFLVPAIATFGGPYLTTFFNMNPFVKYIVSGVIGIIAGSLGGQYTDIPMKPDAGASMGLGSSIAGQTAMNMWNKHDVPTPAMLAQAQPKPVKDPTATV